MGHVADALLARLGEVTSDFVFEGVFVFVTQPGGPMLLIIRIELI
jgi:hypothetical protein